MKGKRTIPRILIADNLQLMGDACKRLLEPEFNVVGVITDGRKVTSAAVEFKPEIIILEIYMPYLNGLDAGVQVKERLPDAKLVFLTTNADATVASEAFRRGASGYVLKQSAGTELVFALREVNTGSSYLSPLVATETVGHLLAQGPDPDWESLITKRQSEILQLLARGLSMKAVAEILKVTKGTVAFHKYRMMKVLNIDSNAELMKYAVKRQMTPAEALLSLESSLRVG